jgi:hypothetical protein
MVAGGKIHKCTQGVQFSEGREAAEQRKDLKRPRLGMCQLLPETLETAVWDIVDER